MRTLRTLTVAAAFVAAAFTGLAVGPTPVDAQIGAIGGAPGGVVGATDITTRAPVFTESALTLPAGTWTVSALMGVTGGGITAVGQTFDYTVTQVLLGAYYGVTDRLLIGATIFPYAGVEVEALGFTEEETGHGDATAYAKFQAFSSADGRTSAAAIGTLGVPLGDDNFGAQGVVLGLAGIMSHALDRVSMHAGAGVSIPTDDLDGNSVVSFTGAAVYAARPNISLALELLGTTVSTDFDRFTSIELAPGARFRVGTNVFINGGLQFNVSSSPFDAPYDYAVLLGVSLSR
ncbi:hypothetical protein BH23GEM9_BH23GEM9_25950 [soil metagenome]